MQSNLFVCAITTYLFVQLHLSVYAAQPFAFF